jgi:hypothetical protein
MTRQRAGNGDKKNKDKDKEKRGDEMGSPIPYEGLRERWR